MIEWNFNWEEASCERTFLSRVKKLAEHLRLAIRVFDQFERGNNNSNQSNIFCMCLPLQFPNIQSCHPLIFYCRCFELTFFEEAHFSETFGLGPAHLNRKIPCENSVLFAKANNNRGKNQF